MSDARNIRVRRDGLLLLWSFLFVPAILLSCIVSPARESGPSAQANRSPSDAFLGAWRFNPDKSAHAGLESKSVVIEAQGSGYKLTIDYVQDNGVKWHFSANTTMKGEIVKTFDKDVKETKQEWRVTLSGPDAFTLEWLGPFGMQEKYQIDGDGKTMTIRDVTVNPRIVGGKIDKNGKLVRVDRMEVFDRVPTTNSAK
jgi:hypothetical protein